MKNKIDIDKLIDKVLLKIDKELNEDMSFSTQGILNAVKESERICMSGYELQKPEIQETSFI